MAEADGKMKRMPGFAAADTEDEIPAPRMPPEDNSGFIATLARQRRARIPTIPFILAEGAARQRGTNV
jgi:hypothetical protein